GGIPSRQEGLEESGPGLVPEPGERPLLDLPDTLARDAEALADLLERQRLRLAEPEIEAEDLGFALAEGAQRVFYGAGEGLGVQLFVGAGGEVVADVVEELTFFAGNQRSIEGEMALGHRQRVLDLLLGKLQ